MAVNSEQLRINIAELNVKVDGYVHALCTYQGDRMVAAAKLTAPWTDRTGNARNGLSTEIGWQPGIQHTIDLFHRVTYGIFLETRWGGRYAIILPTLKVGGRDTMKLLSKLLRKINAGNPGVL